MHSVLRYQICEYIKKIKYNTNRLAIKVLRFANKASYLLKKNRTASGKRLIILSCDPDTTRVKNSSLIHDPERCQEERFHRWGHLLSLLNNFSKLPFFCRQNQNISCQPLVPEDWEPR